jgi:AmmeMemoRadiSam system protein B/AmmeMemoRadiSam system protein A
MGMEKIRESVIAGAWYPGNPAALKKEIQKWLHQAVVSPLEGELIALIAPHAGYTYSGGVAAHAYKLLENHPFDRVLIVAPSHRARFKGSSIYNLGGYRTPLGVAPLDRETVDALFQQSAHISYVPQAHEQEHSLEIQLPFLQAALGDFRLTPIVMGDQSYHHCKQLSEAIANACRGKKVLLIASSDLSHYHSYGDAKTLDSNVIDRVAALDPQGLAQNLQKGRCEACGGGPMTTVMLAAQRLGANKAKVLHYANSGDVTGDHSGVVGYMAAAFYVAADAKESQSHDVKRKAGIDLGLSDNEKETLRQIAYNAIRSECRAEPLQKDIVMTPKLEEHRGAFVCIHKDGELRGCIGLIEGRGPLHETVRKMAIQAAFSDPRFSCVRPEELDRLELEISVLTPLERVSDISKIEVGKHGLVIRRGYSSGLLLPQVATEYNWNVTQFLEHTCRKAGLPLQAWKDPDTEIYAFSADVF